MQGVRPPKYRNNYQQTGQVSNSQSVFPDSLQSMTLTSAQEWYLRCVAKEAVRLTAAILSVQRRQQDRSQSLLSST